MPRTTALLLALFVSPIAFADPLIDALNADKVKIAEAYKASIQACQGKPAKQQAACRKNAEQVRQDALHAASQERDTGLKCRDNCGRVREVKLQDKDGDGSMVGTVGGGVAGAVIGRKLAGGASSSGKNVATAVGAVGGALLGKKLEQKLTRHQTWSVSYTLYNGQTSSADFNDDPGLQPGDRIELRDGKPVKR